MPTYLLTWNPVKWHWADLQECVDEAKARGYFDTDWSCGLSKGIEEGDRLFILRQGVEPRGIFGSGHATSGVFERPHWDTEKAAAGKAARYVRLRFDTLLNPEAEPILPREWLGRGPLAPMHWATQISGVTLPDEVAGALEGEWARFLETRGAWRFAGAPETPDDDRGVGPSGGPPSRRKGERVFGHVPGYPEGSLFDSRVDLSAAGVHRPTQAGISGGAEEGADSIVLSGGYEDDQDLGDLIIYTGHGGRDPSTGHQVRDQALTLQNLALARNKTLGLPVRVIRGGRHRSPFSPQSGYRYDGLYRVDDYWHERGRSGFRVWRYRLLKIRDDDFGTASERPSTQGDQARGKRPERRETTVLRIVRDTKKAKEVKALYDFACQVCGERLEGSAGPYAEAAHIRPLGAPHDGPDTLENLLCLCPNHHVLFDLGGFTVADDFTLVGVAGRLRVHPRHNISREHLRYHREHYSI